MNIEVQTRNIRFRYQEARASPNSHELIVIIRGYSFNVEIFHGEKLGCLIPSNGHDDQASTAKSCEIRGSGSVSCKNDEI